MATRRARIQVKPNIAGKSSSLNKRGQNNVEKGNAIQISAELAVGAAAAVNTSRDTGSLQGTSSPTKNISDKVSATPRDTGSLQATSSPTKIISDKVSSTPSKRADSKDRNQLHSENKGDSELQNETNNILPVSQQTSFTRLKRFGLNSGSSINQGIERGKIDSGSKTLTTSPDKPTDTVITVTPKNPSDISNSPSNPSKTIEIPKPVNSLDNAKRTITRRFSSNVPKLTVKSPLLSSNSAMSSLLSPNSLKSPLLSPSSLKSPLLSPNSLKSPLLSPNSLKSAVISPNSSKSTLHSPDAGSSVKSPTTSINQQMTSPVSQDKNLNQSSLEVEKIPDQHIQDKQRAKDGSKQISVQPTKPSVIQRLPFRSRFPKAKPNIEALRIRNKNLSMTGNKEDGSSRPSSPLKSPRTGKLFSPIRLLQHAHTSTSPVEIDGQTVVQKDNSPESNKDGTPEGRKRHYSNSSISTVNSEIHTPFKNHKQKSPKKDISSSDLLDRTNMTMGDLVYWNPLKNPMIPVTPKKKARLEKEKENVNIQEIPPPVEPVEEEKTEGSDLPVPQVKIGPDGSIILNEESLIIKKADDAPTTEVIEENENTATYASFRKPLNRIGWTEWDTEKFYRALSYLGTDFSLMIKLFPKRTRYDIKAKFKREDKLNRNKVEYALKNKKQFDMSFFEKEIELDKKEMERKLKSLEEKVKKSKLLRIQKKKEKMEIKIREKCKTGQVEKSDRKTRGKIKHYVDGDSSEEDIKDQEIAEIELTPEISVKTPVRKQGSSLPFGRYDSSPFVPPFCLPNKDDTDRDNMELQVTMSDTEIVSPQKPRRSEVTSVTRNTTTGKMTDPVALNDTTTSENSLEGDETMADNVTAVNSELTVNESSIDIASAGFPPNANVQIAHDANNLPLVLVYHTPEDGKGETVIHVYQLQNHQIGNVQIPLNSDGSTVIDLHNSLQSTGTISVGDNEQVQVEGQSEQPMALDNTYEQENIPFLISSGDENSSQLLVQPISEDVSNEQLPGVSNENEGFINIIDINASKIMTPNKTINVQIQNNMVTDRTGYQVTVNPNNDLESSSTSTDVAIDNEFVASDVDSKFNDQIDVDKTTGNSDR